MKDHLPLAPHDASRMIAATNSVSGMNEERLSDFLRLTSDWMWEIDENLNVTYVSDQFEVGKRSFSFLIGMHFSDLYELTADVDRANQLYEILKNRKPFSKVLFHVLHPDGEAVAVKLSGIPKFKNNGSFLGYRGAAVEVTEDIIAREAAVSANALLRDAIDSMSEGIFIYDSDEKLVLCNLVVREVMAKVPEAIEPGSKVEDCIRVLVRSGTTLLGDQSEDEHVAESLTWFRSPGAIYDLELSNGTWWRASNYRTSSGGTISVRADITELKKAEFLLRNVIENLPVSVQVYGADERLFLCNTLSKVIFHQIADILIPGAHRDDLLREGFSRGMLDRRGEKIEEALASTRRRIRNPGREYKMRLLDGRWLLCRDTLLATGGIISTYTDVTDLKRAEQELRIAIEGMSDGFAVWGSHDQLILWNSQFKRMYDDIVEFDNHRGKGFAEIMSPLVDRDLVIPEANETNAGWFARRLSYHCAPTEKPFLMSLRDGRQIEIRERRTSTGGCVSLYLDVTERRKTEEFLRLAQKMESLGTLAGGIAHDLNNVLVPIIGLTEVSIASLPKDWQERELLGDVLSSAQRAKDLVEQILAFSRKDGAETEIIDLVATVADTIKLVRSAISPNILMQHDFGSVPMRIVGNRTQIHQVTMNLVNNAAQAIGIHHGHITIALKRQRMRDDEGARLNLSAGDYVKLSVRDDGAGMDSQTLERIFDPFFTTKEVGKGTGLGLSIIHGIVASHRGGINVDSCLGEGTCFDVYFPLIDKAD